MVVYHPNLLPRLVVTIWDIALNWTRATPGEKERVRQYVLSQLPEFDPNTDINVTNPLTGEWDEMFIPVHNRSFLVIEIYNTYGVRQAMLFPSELLVLL